MSSSEVAPGSALASPRSLPPKWGQIKKTRYWHKKSIHIPTSPSAAVRPSTTSPSNSRAKGKKGLAARIPKPSPKSLIQRMSDDIPLAGKAANPAVTSPPPESPTSLLERLMKSEALSTILSHESNSDTTMVQEPTADNSMIKDGPLTTPATHLDMEKPSRPASPISLDVNEVQWVGGELGTIKQEISSPSLASPVNDHPPTTSSAPENASGTLNMESKRLIVRLVMQNAQARGPGADAAARSEKLEEQVAGLVTDECCKDFIAMAKQVQEQMATKQDSTVGESGTRQVSDSVVGVKRRRDEVDHDDAESSSSSRSRVRRGSDGSSSGFVRVDGAASSSVGSFLPSMKPAPRAPKAMIMKRQDRNTMLSVEPPFPHDIPASDSSARNSTHVRPNSQHEISIPRDARYSKAASPDGQDPNGNTKKTRRNGRDNDEISLDFDDRRRDLRNSDLADHERRANDIRKEIDRHDSCTESRYGKSRSERSEYRRRDRDDHDDRERGYNSKHHSSYSDTRKHSSAKSSRHHTSGDIIATRMSAPEMSIPPGSRPCKPSPTSSTLPVPGLWFVKVGLEHADILSVEFDYSPEPMTRSHPENSAGITFHLLCLPTNSVQDTFAKLNEEASPAVVTDAMWNIKTQWPPRGKLLIEMNPGDNVGRTWLPSELDPAGLAINLTTHVRQGSNNIRFIQLGDLSNHVFMLHARPSQPSDQIVNSQSMATQDLDLDSYFHRSAAKTRQDPEACADIFKFFVNVTHSPL